MISDQIGLDLLRTFVTVCQHGSLSRVATLTGRTQSALSMQMRRLEELLGQQLFQRTGRGVVTTAEGELFLGYATRILALSEEAVARVQQTEISGVVRIALAEEVATAALPATLGRLRRAYPDLRLDVMVEHSIALGPIWNEGELDIMVSPTAVVNADPLVAWDVELQWVCASDYEVGREGPLDIVIFPAPCTCRRQVLETVAELGREPRVAFTSQSVLALQAAVESGLGVGVLQAEAIKAGAMRVLKPADGMPEPISMQYGLYARARPTPVMQAAIDTLLEGIFASSGVTRSTVNGKAAA